MKNIPWFNPVTGNKEKKLIYEVLESNFLNEGDFTTRFEKKIAKLLDCKYSVSVTSGTIAMYLSLKAINVKFGDEVIVSDMTFIATANAVSMCGAKPVLVDVDRNSLMIDPKELEKAITKKTKALIPTHISGRPANMEKLIDIANKHNIFVVEDAAEAFMSMHNGKFLGTFGITGCFSFSPQKIITTGQGGIIVTNNKKIQSALRELKDQGRPKRGTGGDDIHKTIGYNFKFTNIQAAIGLGQLTYLKKRINRLKKINQLYKNYLHEVKEISIFNIDTDNGGLPLWTDCLAEKRDNLNAFLKSKGVECRKFWLPIHTQRPYKLSDKNFPNSTLLSPKSLWLPSAFTMKDSDVKYVCQLIKQFYSYEKNR
ncbi:MAG: DegT/DnrJ/EryC1/StrS family aminotransferase [Patescibacteria group bacterium]|nr:DegT/DnrJ/EryC1/StrS family aminotransferase [Patescibacteria group bacterium]